MNDKNELELLALIADLYYMKDVSQNDIAEKLFFSRSKVSRMLKKAKETGVVTINIKYPYTRDTELEEKLISRFSLDRVFVLRDSNEYSSEDISMTRIASFAAEYISDIIKENMIVGVSSGRTLFNVANEISAKELSGLKFVQVKGMANQEEEYLYDSPKIIRLLADKYSAQYSQLYSPLFVENDIARQWLVKEPIIHKALQEARQSDILLVSTGPMEAKGGVWSGYIDRFTMDKMKKAAVIGSMLSHFYDINGKIVSREWDRKLIGITLEDMKKIPNVVMVASGLNKKLALIGALRTGTINTLIVDGKLAKAIDEFSN